MQRKLSIGIDIDPHLKKTLAKTIKQWRDLPVRWHKEGGFHIALFSLGWVGEDDMTDIIIATESVATETEGFDIDFEKIAFVAKDPFDSDIDDAQIVRLEGFKSPELKKLYHKLKKTLKIPASQKKIFKPYVELGRMRTQKWQKLEKYPAQSYPFPVVMDVSAITIFENSNEEGEWHITPMEVFDLQ